MLDMTAKEFFQALGYAAGCAWIMFCMWAVFCAAHVG